MIMKKMLLIFGIITIIMSCNSTNKNSNTGSSTKDTVNTKKTGGLVYKTLNGVDQIQALAMIEKFDTTCYQKQKLSSLNFWFSRAVINDIVNLIKDDSVRQINAAHHVDGIRVYFASDIAVPSNISILLVTTVDSTSSATDSLHHDYYCHADSELLFSDTGIAGTVYKPGQSKGANLYKANVLGIFDDLTCNFGKHPHYIRRAMAHKMVVAFGNDIVNSRGEWFPKDLFEDMTNSQRCDGMRIYFAKHPPKGNTTTAFNNRDAFVIATTQEDKTNKFNHNDYFDCTTFEQSVKKHAPSPFVYRINVAGQDNGSLCPNNCN